MDIQDPLSFDLQKYTEIIVKQLHFQSYHFIELFIYFNNFIEDDAIGEESFLTANTTLIDHEEEEEVINLFKEIFSILTPSKHASIITLCCYLKKISISTRPDFDVDTLFFILDKDNKGHIEYPDIEILISSFEDFIGETGHWEVYENSFSGKKIIKRNLTQNHFYDELKLLFSKANKIIEDKLLAAKKAIEMHQHAITKLTMPNIQGEASGHSKVDSVMNNNNVSHHCHSNGSSSEKNKQSIPINNNNELKDRNNITVSAANSYSNIDNNNSSIPNNSGIDDLIFDKRKIEIITKIKSTSYLYDLNHEDFVNEFMQYEGIMFDKESFITVVNDIISKKTSDLFHQPMKKLALSMLFQIIDYEHKNRISFYEAIGGIIPLLKSHKDSDTIRIFFKYPKDKIIHILSGTMSIYLNTEKIKDIAIFSEIILQNWKEAKVNNLQDLFQWMYKDTPKESELQYSNFVLNTEIEVPPNDNDLNELFEEIHSKFIKLKENYPNEIRSLSILSITDKILKYSFLGVINNFQISNMLDSVFSETFYLLPQTQRDKLKNECYLIIEKNFDFTQTELIDITHFHAFSMLVFSGNTIEKFQSIFAIFDLADNDPIEYEDLCDYLTHLFDFTLKETKIKYCNGKTLARIICDYIVNNFDKKITLTCLTQVFDSLVNSFPKKQHQQ